MTFYVWEPPLEDAGDLTKEKIVWEKKGGQTAPVTVTITLYNYENYIVEALNSVLEQTLRPLDLVIVDDHSNDRSLPITVNWVTTHQENFNRIICLQHHSNQGLGKSRNAAIRRAVTEHIFILDADNQIYPPCLEKLLAGLKRSGAAFAYCYLEEFGALNRLGGIDPWDPKRLQHGNAMDAMALHKKEILEAVGGFAEDMPVNGWEDFELWFKLAQFGSWGIRIPEILARYRVHDRAMHFIQTDPSQKALWDYLTKKYPEFF